MIKEYFIGKKCKVYYNDFADHVAYIKGIVVAYNSSSKEAVVENEFNGMTTGVTRIRIEVLE